MFLKWWIRALLRLMTANVTLSVLVLEHKWFDDGGELPKHVIMIIL
jgi:hypothetical protein